MPAVSDTIERHARNTFRLCYRWAATFRLEGSGDSFHRTPRIHHALAGAGAGWPVGARAQQGDRTARIGVLKRGSVSGVSTASLSPLTT
jgi:hypothetical protein